jgi:hypothetical protein
VSEYDFWLWLLIVGSLGFTLGHSVADRMHKHEQHKEMMGRLERMNKQLRERLRDE